MWGARGWGASDLSGFNWPRDISYAPSTNTLWVADTKNNRLLEFHTDGSSTGTSITVGGALTWPYAVDASGGSLIVADTFAAKVESWTGSTATGRPTSSGGTPLKNPYDVAVSKGVVYVADSANKRIVELNAATGADMGSFGARLPALSAGRRGRSHQRQHLGVGHQLQQAGRVPRRRRRPDPDSERAQRRVQPPGAP